MTGCPRSCLGSRLTSVVTCPVRSTRSCRNRGKIPAAILTLFKAFSYLLDSSIAIFAANFYNSHMIGGRDILTT